MVERFRRLVGGRELVIEYIIREKVIVGKGEGMLIFKLNNY